MKDDRHVGEKRLMAIKRVRLPKLFEGVRVEWYYGRGTITAVYSNGTIDVESDYGPTFEGWPFHTVRLEGH